MVYANEKWSSVLHVVAERGSSIEYSQARATSVVTGNVRNFVDHPSQSLQSRSHENDCRSCCNIETQKQFAFMLSEIAIGNQGSNPPISNLLQVKLAPSN